MERLATAKLRQFIHNTGLSMRQWCERAELDHSEISRLLSGARGSKIRPQTAQKIEKATGGYVPASAWASAPA